MVIREGPGAQWGDAGLAVPCLACNVEIGKPCETRPHPVGPVPYRTHRPRRDRAAAFGFRAASGLNIVKAMTRLRKPAPTPSTSRPRKAPALSDTEALPLLRFDRPP